MLITPGNQPMTAVLTFWIAIGLFFTSAPQQLLMTEAGQGGGELIAGAAVQVAFNFGNAIGSIVGGAMLTTFSMNYRYTGLGGMPLALLAVGLLAFYSVALRNRYRRHSPLARNQGGLRPSSQQTP